MGPRATSRPTRTCGSCTGSAGEPLLRPDLAAVYDAFETPRTVRGEIELLDAAGAREYLDDVRARTLAARSTTRHRTP